MDDLAGCIRDLLGNHTIQQFGSVACVGHDNTAILKLVERDVIDSWE